MNDEDNIFRAWKTPGADEDFADRVLARRVQPPRRGKMTVAAVCLLGLSAWLVSRVLRSEAAGTHLANERRTVAIADRAIVVAETETKLAWTVQPFGATSVQQDSGAAFYRVDQGEVFTVNTPFGSIDVRGTCFRVELRDMRTMKVIAASAALSAAVTGALFVTVYEGRVAVAGAGAPLDLAAGESGFATPGQAARIVTPVASVQMPTAAAADAPPQEQGHVALNEIVALREALAESQRQVTLLKMFGASAPTSAQKGNETFRPSPEELQQMAKKCEIRVDLPGGMFGRKELEVKADLREKYELTESEGKAFQNALVAMQKEAQVAVRDYYVQVTGDAEAGKWLSPQAMFEELKDKISPAAQAIARQRISAERAGLQAAADPSTLSAADRFHHWFADLPELFEAKVARELGPERARAMHDKFEGWLGSRWGSSGCPK